MKLMQIEIARIITTAIESAQEIGALPHFAPPEIVVERPKDPSHGDYAVPSALQMARLARMAPLQIAERIVNFLEETAYFSKVEVAPPGFINFRLAESWLVQQVDNVLQRGPAYGCFPPQKGGPKKVQVEFLSANPTGPFVVGSGRNAVLGDTLANLFQASGYEVQREYYINDVGTQIDHLATALQVRYAQALGEEVADPKEYAGQYLVEIGEVLAEEYGDQFLHGDNTDFMRREALSRILNTIREDTELIGVRFDRWFSEASLYTEQTYDLVYSKLESQALLFERDGAIWLRSDEDDEDKENVVVRSDGRPTYFASDIAYVWDKLVKRNFDRAIYIWGADHHGHVKRLKGATEALTLDPYKITIILYQLVSITRDGEPVRQSKRSGDFITVREVVEEIGSDAFRFMLLTRSADSAMELDLELAKRESSENPVYYIQYAHARITSIFRRAKEDGATMGGGDVNLLEHPSEIELIRQILRFPEAVRFATDNLAPHQLTYYAQELAAAFHAFYRDCHVVIEDDELTAARLKLVKAAQITLANNLHIMGMSVPDQM
ncbi:arginine--tRNA ligase [Anaerolineales bacterium HSG6]|nr:arginine--tRNA ligase [Anaerolineales bacterium HSG6]MDM8530267.1 arginine--tRNA ligase [Anaerolineales bacterium HSG25]